MSKESGAVQRDALAHTFSLAPVEQIAEIVGEPGIADELKKNRIQSIGLRLAAEFNDALSTYALFNIQEHPGLYGISVGSELVIEAQQSRARWDFHKDIMGKIRRRITTLTPYMSLINTKLRDRGFANVYTWSLWYNLYETETEKLGLERIATLAHPILQAVAASKDLSLPYALAAAGVSYGLVPLFSKLGSTTSTLNDKHSYLMDARDQSYFYGAKVLLHKLNEKRDRVWNQLKNYRVIQLMINKLPKLGFSLAAFLTKSNDVGLYGYFFQLISTPSRAWSMKEAELNTKNKLGFIASMHEIMSGHPYLLTTQSWDAYRNKKMGKIPPMDTSNFLGLETVGLKTKIPDKSGERMSAPLTLKAKRGQVVLLSANSGEGKSVTTGLGFAGLVETDGFLYFHDQSATRPLESLNRTEVDDRVVYIAPSHDYDELRIVDIYQRIGIAAYCEQAQKTVEELDEYELMMLSIPDALLEKELYILADVAKIAHKERTNWYGYDHPESKNIVLDGVKAVFPMHMFDQIHAFRQLRNTLVESEIRPKGANYASLKADEPIGDLSTGMKIRFLFELNKEMHSHAKDPELTRIFIFDEPFAHLDSDNTLEYLEQIKKLTEEENPPVVIIISHKEQDVIERVLADKVVHATFE